jgi:hypothetical protein
VGSQGANGTGATSGNLGSAGQPGNAGGGASAGGNGTAGNAGVAGTGASSGGAGNPGNSGSTTNTSRTMQKSVSRGATASVTIGTGSASGTVTISWNNQ